MRRLPFALMAGLVLAVITLSVSPAAAVSAGASAPPEQAAARPAAAARAIEPEKRDVFIMLSSSKTNEAGALFAPAHIQRFAVNTAFVTPPRGISSYNRWCATRFSRFPRRTQTARRRKTTFEGRSRA